MAVNSALLENERDDGAVVQDIETNGVKKTAEEMHVVKFWDKKDGQIGGILLNSALRILFFC